MEGCGSFPSHKSMVKINFPDNYFYLQVYFGQSILFCSIASPSLHKYTDGMVVFIL